MAETGGHIPVLAEEVLYWLRIDPAGTYVDGTAGAGGHSEQIARQLTSGRLIALDRDLEAVARASKRLADFACASVYHANYGAMAAVLAELGIEAVDGILIDAGLSSVQLDDPERGFTFQADGPLDMRMDRTTGPAALEWLKSVTEPELAGVLRQYGDVGPARRIARSICRRRAAQQLERTRDVAEAVAEALDFVAGVPEETRTVFQALRMAVNEELHWLEEGLHQGVGLLRPGGRIVAIAFHSGEDRVVKNVFREESRVQRLTYPDGRVRSVTPARLRVLTPKPVLPGDEEIRSNPRAKSAKLRVAERRVDES